MATSTLPPPTDDGASDQAPPVPDDVELLCDAAARIRTLDDASDAITAELTRAAMTGDADAAAAAFPRVVSGLEELLPRLQEAYDDLEAAAPEALKAKAAEVRDLSVELMATMSSAESFEAFREAFSDVSAEAAESAGAAAIELDELTTRECDVSIAD